MLKQNGVPEGHPDHCSLCRARDERALKDFVRKSLAEGDHSIACQRDLEDFVCNMLSETDRETVAERVRARMKSQG